MMWRELISLRDITYSVNEYGDRIESANNQVVYANKKSIRQSEFYQAHAFGLKPELMFEVRTIEFAGQEQLMYNGKVYNIIRTYSKNDEITELICTGIVGGG